MFFSDRQEDIAKRPKTLKMLVTLMASVGKSQHKNTAQIEQSQYAILSRVLMSSNGDWWCGDGDKICDVWVRMGMYSCTRVTFYDLRVIPFCHTGDYIHNASLSCFITPLFYIYNKKNTPVYYRETTGTEYLNYKLNIFI